MPEVDPIIFTANKIIIIRKNQTEAVHSMVIYSTPEPDVQMEYDAAFRLLDALERVDPAADVPVGPLLSAGLQDRKSVV